MSRRVETARGVRGPGSLGRWEPGCGGVAGSSGASGIGPMVRMVLMVAAERAGVLERGVVRGRGGPGLRERGYRRERGYTLLEVIVSLSVVVVLVMLLLPALNRAQGMAYRLVCASHLREIGTGLTLYAQDRDGLLPPTVFIPEPMAEEGELGLVRPERESHEALLVRLSEADRLFGFTASPSGFDGFGLLFEAGVLVTPEVFYCPAHRGANGFDRFNAQWFDEVPGEIVGNYHYRGGAPNGDRRLARLVTGEALATDGIRAIDELNHPGGLNVLDVTLSVAWVDDDVGRITGLLPPVVPLASSLRTELVWGRLDDELLPLK